MSHSETIKEMLEKLKSHEIEYISITPKKHPPKSITSSKFGGRAYWPHSLEYPTDSHDKPLYLLAQLNFSEIPSLKDFPKEGLLQFFIADDDVFGAGFDSTGEKIANNSVSYRVVYHKTLSTDINHNVVEPTDSCYLPVVGEYSLDFALRKEVPSPTDISFEHACRIDLMKLDDDTTDYFYDNFDASVKFPVMPISLKMTHVLT